MTEVYLAAVLVMIAVMAIITAVNVLGVRSLDRHARAKGNPRVSVLLPARNEELNIGLALSTLVEQEYRNIEILVLDDNSDDGTHTVATAWAARDPRVRVLRGEPLPAGWVGKSFACHQLARAAAGDLLLFADADTVHTRFSVGAGVSAMQETGADLLTVIPRQRTESFWEKVVLPMLHFFTFSFLPVPLVSRTRHPSLAMANGQYMLWRRDAYRAVGGHEAVRRELVEDVWLARRVKRAGRRLVITYGGSVVSCRMYASLSDIWNGFSKNLFAGFGYSLPILVGAVLFNVMTSVIPFLILADIVLIGAWGMAGVWLIVVQVALVVLIRVAQAGRFDMALWPVLFHPVAAVIVIGIMVNSCRWVLSAGGARWKGRVYDMRNEALPS